MNNQDNLEIELILFPSIVSQFELINEDMPPQVKVLKKKETFDLVRTYIEEFCKDRDLEIEAVNSVLTRIAENRINTVTSKSQYNLMIETFKKIDDVLKENQEKE